MHPNLGRDIPLLLGALALVYALARTTSGDACTPPPDGENPQWLCRVMFYFVGTVLIGFGILGHYSPY